jgi:hypothetical protein
MKMQKLKIKKILKKVSHKPIKIKTTSPLNPTHPKIKTPLINNKILNLSLITITPLFLMTILNNKLNKIEKEKFYNFTILQFDNKKLIKNIYLKKIINLFYSNNNFIFLLLFIFFSKKKFF